MRRKYISLIAIFIGGINLNAQSSLNLLLERPNLLYLILLVFFVFILYKAYHWLIYFKEKQQETKRLKEVISSLLVEQVKTKTKNEIQQGFNQKLDEADKEFLEKIKTHILEHMGEHDFGVERLCHFAKMSHTQFHRRMVSLTGIPPVKLIIHMRLNAALGKLKNSTRSIGDIAYEVGFKEPSYFSRVFKKKYGFSPSHARTKINDCHLG